MMEVVIRTARESIRKAVLQVVKGWNRFFFEQDPRARITLFRFVFGIILFIAYAVRSVDSELYFGQSGMLDIPAMMDSFPMKYRWSLLVWFPSDIALWIHTTVFLVALLSMAFGFFPRFSAFVAFLLHVSFMHRNMAIVYGLDMISVFFLLYLSIANTRLGDEAMSARERGWSALLTSVALRLIQIQLCVIYAYSGWEKLKGLAWWRGEAMWLVFASPQFARFDLGWVSHFPLVLSLMTYLTLLWEIYFPVAIWIPRLRPWLLVGGILMHLGIALTILIPFFSAIMVSIYVTFLTEERAKRLLNRFVKNFYRNPQASPFPADR